MSHPRSGKRLLVAVVVQKFGGTSVRNAERVRAVAEHIARTTEGGSQPIVTVSAMGDETDELLDLVPLVGSARSGRELDALITAGESKAAALLCLALQDRGVPADSFTGSQAGIVTTGEHTNAAITAIHPDRVRESLEAGRVPVIGGAQGVSVDGNVTFLGRGGTDITAVALAFTFAVDECELYTDVAGVFTADPRLVPEARLLCRVSFEEMLEMCRAGCPKPNLRAVEVARDHGVPLHIRSAFTWQPGTWVADNVDGAAGLVCAVIAGEATQERSGDSRPDRDTADVSLVGRMIGDDPDFQGRVLDALAAAGIAAEVVSASPIRVSCRVRTRCAERTVRVLHHELGLGAAGMPEAPPQVAARSPHRAGEGRSAAPTAISSRRTGGD